VSEHTVPTTDGRYIEVGRYREADRVYIRHPTPHGSSTMPLTPDNARLLAKLLNEQADEVDPPQDVTD